MSRLFYKLLILNSFFFCFLQAAHAEFADIARIFRDPPNDKQFEVCQGGGCAKVSKVGLTKQDWLQIKKIFMPRPADAEQERYLLANAIGQLEKIVGNKVGTSQDRAGTFGNSDYPGQLDCNDEAINTTTYIRLLKQAGLIYFHEVEDMRTRNFFFTGWPHSTAVMHAIETGERFAVDSWFYDNGHPATIVPFKVWKANYKPEDSPVGKERE